MQYKQSIILTFFHEDTLCVHLVWCGGRTSASTARFFCSSTSALRFNGRRLEVSADAVTGLSVCITLSRTGALERCDVGTAAFTGSAPFTRCATLAHRLCDSTHRALPKPGLVVDDLNLFAGEKAVANGAMCLIPTLEVNENAVELIAVVVLPLNNVDAVHTSFSKQLLEGVLHLLPGDILKCTRNADTRLILHVYNGSGRVFGRHSGLDCMSSPLRKKSISIL